MAPAWEAISDPGGMSAHGVSMSRAGIFSRTAERLFHQWDILGADWFERPGLGVHRHLACRWRHRYGGDCSMWNTSGFFPDGPQR